MENFKIIKDIEEYLNELTKKYEFENNSLSIYKENIIKLSMYKLSQMPYFNGRYDFMRLKSLNNDEKITIESQKSNALPLLTNQQGNNINANFLIDDTFLDIHKSEIFKKSIDIDMLKKYSNIIEESDNFFELMDKIKFLDNINDDFIVNLKRQKEESYKKTNLLDFVVYFLDEKEGVNEKKKLNIYERNKPVDMFLLRDSFSMETYSYINKSPKEIIKTIKTKEDPIKELSNLLNRKIKINSSDFKKALKNINNLIKKGHPVLKKTPFNVLMSVSEKTPEIRVKTLIDTILFEKLKNKELLEIKNDLENIRNEEEFIKKYEKEIKFITDKIIEKYPIFNNNIQYMDNFTHTEKNINKDSLTPLDNFSQNWIFFNSWDINESFKGIGFMNEEFVNNNYNKDKTIISIKNDLENVGYITLYKSDNVLRLHSISPTTEVINNPNFIKEVNKSIENYVNKNNIKLLVIDTETFPSDSQNLISKDSIDLYLNDINCYIVGNKFKKFKRTSNIEKENNIVNEQINEIFNNRILDELNIKISDKVINQFKELEKKYEHIEKGKLPFDKEFKLIKDIREEIINNVETPTPKIKEKRLKNV